MDRTKAGLLVFLLPATFPACSQPARGTVAAGYAGLSAYSLNHVNLFSFTANPAALAQLKKTSVAFYGEKRFLLSGLNHYLAVSGITTSSGNFGFRAGFSGFSDYNEAVFGLAYGRKVGNKMDLGAQFNYQVIRVAGYGNASAIGFDLGTILHITEHFHAGMHLINPVRGKAEKERYVKMSPVYSFGVGYDASEKFMASAIIEKEEDQAVNVISGIQYQFLPQWLVRIGLSSSTSSAWMGFGLTMKSIHLDLSTVYHPQLGITPGLLLLFKFKPASPGRVR